MNRHMTHEEHETAKAAARFGYGPLAHVNSQQDRLPAFGGEFQPGLYRQVKDRKIANPAPLGLCAFALTTFVLGLINMGTAGVTTPNIVVGAAFGYGGLVQLLAGMWYVTALFVLGLFKAWHKRPWLTWQPLLGRWLLEILLVLPPYPPTGVSGSPSPSSLPLAVSRLSPPSKLLRMPQHSGILSASS